MMTAATDWEGQIADVLDTFIGRQIDDAMKAEVKAALQLATPGLATVLPADWANGEFKVQVELRSRTIIGTIQASAQLPPTPL